MRVVLAHARARRHRADPRGREPGRLLRPRPCAAGRVADARARRAGRGRPQRHGQDHAVQRHHRPGAAPRGSIRLAGEEILGLPPNEITNRGVGYVPQGRRVWPSLTVDEHLRLAAHGRRGPWTVERDLRDLPAAGRAPAQRRRPALGRRAADARDRPRAAPQPAAAGHGRADRGAGAGHRRAGRRRCCRRLAAEGEISVLLIEQNLGVAIDVADTVAVMVNGRIARTMPAARAGRRPRPAAAAAGRARRRRRGRRRRAADGAAEAPTDEPIRDLHRQARRGRRRRRPPADGERARCAPSPAGTPPIPPPARATGCSRRAPSRRPRRRRSATSLRRGGRDARVVELPVAATAARAAYVAGTFDTKGRELFFLRSCLEKLGLRTVTVDLSTSGKPSPADVHPREVARHHPRASAPCSPATAARRWPRWRVAFERFIAAAPRPRRPDLGRRLGRHRAGHAGDARLPIGVPKVMVSTRRLGRREALRRARPTSA